MRTSPRLERRIFISAGEVSGDIVGARLAAALLEREPATRIYGVGGGRMEAAGVAVDFDTNHLGTIGLSEALRTLPAVGRSIRRIRRRILSERPDVAVLIANDIFNTALGRWLRARGIRTVSYFPPQAWVWGAFAKSIAPSFDAILTSFPEEQAVYAATGVPSTFVGHYLGDTLGTATPAERCDARARLGVPAASRVVGLLPGSRLHEVTSLAPILLDAALELARKDADIRFLLPVAEPLFREILRREIERRALGDRVLLTENSHESMRASDLLLMASGTASLEAALLGIPMVLVYKLSRFTMGVIHLCHRVGILASETIGLPNLILGRMAVPELRQERATAPAIAQAAAALLGDPVRRHEMRAALGEVASRVMCGPCLPRVAELVLGEAARGAVAAAASEAARPMGVRAASDVPNPAAGSR
jgi:lipid-A-disaccharide synthase